MSTEKIYPIYCVKYLIIYRGIDMTQETTIASIKQLYISLDKIIKKNDYNKIDYILIILPSLEWSYEIKASVLRYTFRTKHNLKNWDIALDNFRKELDELGLNSKDILIGLI